MKISKKDWIFIFIIAAVFIGFYLISGEEKTTKVPYDEAHRQFYDIAKASGKMEAEPKYLTRGAAGAGFAELVAHLIGHLPGER